MSTYKPSILLTTLLCTTPLTGARFFKPPKPNVPDPPAPNVPKINDPYHPAPNTPWVLEPNVPPRIPPQEMVKLNMAPINKKFDAMDAVEMVGSMPALVSAILATPTVEDSSLNSAFSPTSALPSSTFSSSSFPIESFEYCTSYARILSSCASATPGFYQASATAQASCACYSTSTLPSNSCTKDERLVATPTLATTRLDNPAIICRAFMVDLGYTNVAEALSGRMKTSNSTDGILLGQDFCKNVDEGIKAKGNSTRGLGQTGQPSAYRVCAGLVGSSDNTQVQSGVRGLVLARFDFGVLAGYSVVVAAMSWVVFT
ncbi:hypothetical protein P154DRAFT_530254 [Amniculicola lignicola CBS 123094]|uniref:Uncharacterized protein n=1 Tax=Amniculicola lignicola CBS 123094 TaxID=1392246 RepID=A0A6A5X0D6_9PLEO|nr:hypothetical protein P154DRAFT_530254 [Amniculicola lignicola CBS 123094]